MPERRHSTFRRDLNSLFRDEGGNLSGSKLGTYAGQVISGTFLWSHMDDLIDHWDSLTVLFLVLVAPEAYKKFMATRFGGGGEYSERTTTSSSKSLHQEEVTSSGNPTAQ
jgi:hypothetical protein